MSKTVSLQSITMGEVAMASVEAGVKPSRVTLAQATSTTAAAGADPTSASATLTNLGTSYYNLGGMALVTMDEFTSITLLARVGNSPAQSGTISVEIYDATSATSLVTATTSDVGLTNISATAAVALTGVHALHAHIKSSVATDDPLAGWVGIELA